MHLSDITFRRHGDGTDDPIGHVSVTIDRRSHLAKVPVRRSLDGKPYLDLPVAKLPILLRPVRSHARRLFEVQLFAELRKRGIYLEASGDRSERFPAKSDGRNTSPTLRPEPPETLVNERSSEVSP